MRDGRRRQGGDDDDVRLLLADQVDHFARERGNGDRLGLEAAALQHLRKHPTSDLVGLVPGGQAEHLHVLGPAHARGLDDLLVGRLIARVELLVLGVLRLRLDRGRLAELVDLLLHHVPDVLCPVRIQSARVAVAVRQAQGGDQHRFVQLLKRHLLQGTPRPAPRPPPDRPRAVAGSTASVGRRRVHRRAARSGTPTAARTFRRRRAAPSTASPAAVPRRPRSTPRRSPPRGSRSTRRPCGCRRATARRSC